MKLQITTIYIMFLFATPLFARPKTDVLVMNNGDRITCEIKSLSAGSLSINVDYIQSTAAVDWSKVHHVESKQLFIVKSEDGSVYEGLIKTVDSSAGRPVEIVPLAAPEEVVTVKH